MSYSFVDGHKLFGGSCSHHLISKLHCFENRRSCFLRNNGTSYKTTMIRSKSGMNPTFRENSVTKKCRKN